MRLHKRWAFNYPLESFFANAPGEQVEESLRRHGLPTEQITTPYTLLFVDTGHHRALVDTGAGNLGEHAAALFPSVDHSTTVTGKLLDNLRATGIEPSEIDTVVITHAHPDHVGGTLDEAGNLVFEGAHYFVSRGVGFLELRCRDGESPAPHGEHRASKP